MLEQPKLYSLKEAQNEVEKMQKIIESGKVKDYVEAEENFYFGNDIKDKTKFFEYSLFDFDKLEKMSRQLNKKFAAYLIESGNARLIIENLEKFHGLNHKEIALELIKAREGDSMTGNLEKFQGLDKNKIKKFSEKYHLNIGESMYCIYSEEDKGEEKIELIKDDSFDNYQKLKKGHPGWKDQENIIRPFEAGSNIFGYQKMFEYLSRPGLSRHDGLHNFTQIITLMENSGLKPREFYSKILNQVKMDDAGYYEGTAHHHINSLASNVNLNFKETLADARKYPDIKKLQELVGSFEDTKNIFSSWKNLKKYQEMCEILGRKEILDQLQSLKKEGKEKLYTYVETLAFHPNISMEKVMQFWKSPEEFLNIEEIHASESHERKKPSNYIDIPNLDLSAEELRDALVEGPYDQLQSFHPLEIEYKIEKDNEKSLRYRLAYDLGVSDSQIREKTGIGVEEKLNRNPKLFKELNDIFEKEGFDLIKYLKGEQEISEKFKEELDKRFKQDESGEEYRVKINKKSDPDGVVAGNDTACCMPFGSGKNNVYTFNPICALLTVQKKNIDGTYRTVAQSVLTKDKDIKKNVSEILNKVNQENTKMHEFISEDLLIDSPSVITCDNVELAENYKSHPKAGEVLEFLYRDFFKEYTKRYAEEEKIDKNKVVIGVGYSDALLHLPKIDNTFIPEAPVGYSDNLHEEALFLELEDKKSGLTVKREAKQPKAIIKKEIPKLPRGISPLTFKDSLQVAYIEGKAYHENESLIQYLHNMENALIAKDVNNEMKNRPNMSFKYKDEKGKMHGYLLSYEGKINKNGENVIYVADLASDGSKLAGGSLIVSFVDAYKKNYVDQNNPLPMYMGLREKTSYQIIKKQLDKIGKQINKEFEMKELGAYESGGDTMHEVIIRVKE